MVRCFKATQLESFVSGQEELYTVFFPHCTGRLKNTEEKSDIVISVVKKTNFQAACVLCGQSARLFFCPPIIKSVFLRLFPLLESTRQDFVKYDIRALQRLCDLTHSHSPRAERV
jgi:hypothetical protein